MVALPTFLNAFFLVDCFHANTQFPAAIDVI